MEHLENLNCNKYNCNNNNDSWKNLKLIKIKKGSYVYRLCLLDFFILKLKLSVSLYSEAPTPPPLFKKSMSENILKEITLVRTKEVLQ